MERAASSHQRSEYFDSLANFEEVNSQELEEHIEILDLTFNTIPGLTDRLVLLQQHVAKANFAFYKLQRRWCELVVRTLRFLILGLFLKLPFLHYNQLRYYIFNDVLR